MTIPHVPGYPFNAKHMLHGVFAKLDHLGQLQRGRSLAGCGLGALRCAAALTDYGRVLLGADTAPVEILDITIPYPVGAFPPYVGAFLPPLGPLDRVDDGCQSSSGGGDASSSSSSGTLAGSQPRRGSRGCGRQGGGGAAGLLWTRGARRPRGGSEAGRGAQEARAQAQGSAPGLRHGRRKRKEPWSLR